MKEPDVYNEKLSLMCINYCPRLSISSLIVSCPSNSGQSRAIQYHHFSCFNSQLLDLAIRVSQTVIHLCFSFLFSSPLLLEWLWYGGQVHKVRVHNARLRECHHGQKQICQFTRHNPSSKTPYIPWAHGQRANYVLLTSPRGVLGILTSTQSIF